MEIETLQKANTLVSDINYYSKLNDILSKSINNLTDDTECGVYIDDQKFKLPTELMDSFIAIAHQYYEGIIEKFSNEFMEL